MANTVNPYANVNVYELQNGWAREIAGRSRDREASIVQKAELSYATREMEESKAKLDSFLADREREHSEKEQKKLEAFRKTPEGIAQMEQDRKDAQAFRDGTWARDVLKAYDTKKTIRDDYKSERLAYRQVVESTSVQPVIASRNAAIQQTADVAQKRLAAILAQ